MPLATETPRRPVHSTPTPIYLLGLKVWGCCILHFRGCGGRNGVEWGSLPKTDPKGTLPTHAHLPIGQRRCCRGRDAISSRWSALVKPVAPSLPINIGQGGAVRVHFGRGGNCNWASYSCHLSWWGAGVVWVAAIRPWWQEVTHAGGGPHVRRRPPILFQFAVISPHTRLVWKITRLPRISCVNPPVTSKLLIHCYINGVD